MTNAVVVCDAWTLPLQDGDGGYYHYINKRAGEVGRNAHCILWLLQELGADFDEVVEPFGGTGVFATVVQGVVQPQRHYLFDIDPDCLDQLNRAFPGKGVIVTKADAREVIGQVKGDLYILDFPSPFTITHHNKWANQLDGVFNGETKAVIWMDGASFGMQWHKERYSRIFGRPVESNEDYAKAMSVAVHGRWGYSLAAATVSRGCFYFAFTPGFNDSFSLCKFSTKGRGLRPVGSPQPKSDLPVIQQLQVG